MFVFAQAQAPAAAPQAPFLVNILPILLVFFVFYFLLIRPQQKKQKAVEQMLTALKKNDEVVTAGGVHGTIVNVKDTTVVLRIDDNVKVEFQKSAVAQIKKQRKTEEQPQTN